MNKARFAMGRWFLFLGMRILGFTAMTLEPAGNTEPCDIKWVNGDEPEGVKVTTITFDPDANKRGR